ncbi:MAG: hypothetical protein AMJ43_04735 [Coxiella sp. DG_40]|nr:MAG: hypothetical protein AMJ43_04735 [Coxiella sp. DG_40]
MTIVKEPTSIKQILTANKNITRLIKKSSSLQNLNRLFQEMLNDDLSKHCQIAQKTKDSLVIVVDNASWATNLRYAIPDIIKMLRTQPEFKNIRTIRYYINRRSIPKDPLSRVKNSTDMQNARMLKEFAELKERLK